ncbi:MAG TPA: hypothetical protein VL494_20155, partial [Steroidobacteraceae bacterium]|nr:hypothetical protein [Steroidobacteraceae bacterium]
MSETDDRNDGTLNRRSLLKCAAWAGAGVVWVMQGGVLKAVDLIGKAEAAVPKDALSFVQISDSHIGFNKDPNPEPHVTLQAAIEQIRSMPQAPAFVVHT